MSGHHKSGETFTCELCEETFEKGWTDEEAEAEFEALFPDDPPRAVVCEDCFAEVMEWAKSEGIS